MRKSMVVWGLLLVLLIPMASGQGGIDIYTIPSNISVNSSFLWVAELPSGLGDDIRVSWFIGELVELYGATGSFSKVSGNRWFCDFERTCGPNPFPVAGMFLGNIYVTTKSGVLTSSPAITISDLKIDPHLYISGNNVLVQVNIPIYAGSAVLKYSLYDADSLEPVQIGGEAVKNKNLAYCNCPAGFYNTSFTLENGRYYLSFEASTTSDSRSGGSLEYFTLGGELKPLSVSLDKSEYLLGEKVYISGTTTQSKAGSEIRLGGVSKKNITFSLSSRGDYNEFSYDYLPDQTGSYTLYMYAGVGNDTVSKTVGFSVSKLLDVNMQDIYINESESVDKTFTVTNLVNQTLNITVSADDDLANYVTPSLGKGWLGTGESTTLTLNIHNVLSSMQGKVVFHTNTVDVDNAVRIIVERPFEKKPKIGIEPLVWSPEEGYLLGKESKTFTITNQGTGTLEGFDYSISGIDSDIITVTLPPSVGMVPASGEMEVSIDPIYSGRYRGTLRVTSSGGSQDILIDAEFFDDIKTDTENLNWEIQSVLSNLTARGVELPYTVSTLTTDLDDVETKLNNEEYASANRDFEKISKMWDGIKSVIFLIPAGGEMDLSGVLIIVVVLVVIVIVFFLFKKIRGRAGAAERREEEGEAEEDLEEEFY